MKSSPCPMTRRPAAPPPGPPTPIVEEPVMKRYCNPLPCWGGYPVPVPAPDGLDRVLEELTRQNQLLCDLLGAVNSLTAATLSIRGRLVGENGSVEKNT